MAPRKRSFSSTQPGIAPALPRRPQLSHGIVCHLNPPSGYGFLKPTSSPSPCSTSTSPSPAPTSAASLHPAQKEEDRSSNVYFRIPSHDLTSMPHSSCHTGFLPLQVGDTLEFISNRNPGKPRAIYTCLVECSSRTTDAMASYLHHVLSLISRPANDGAAHFDYIVQEITKAPKGFLLVLQHPNSERKLISLVLKLAIAIGNHYQKMASSSCRSRIEKFFQLVAHAPFFAGENAALCRLLIQLQEGSDAQVKSSSIRRHPLSNREDQNLQVLQEVETEWGKPLAAILALIKNLVLRILKEIPKELPYMFCLIQILDTMQIEHQEQAGSSRLSPSKANSFAMQVVDVVAHANGAGHTEFLNVSWNKLSLIPLPSEITSSLDHTPIAGINLPVAKLQGRYDSPEDYIDTYFRLLREDAFASLKKGLSEFSSGPLDPRDMSVWFGVTAVGVHFEYSLPGLVIGLQLMEGQTNSSHPKLPLAGSLLCICDSGGCFRNPIWATAARCESKAKRATILFVEVLGGAPASATEGLNFLLPWARILHASSMVVAESPAYFRAYEPVLKALQHLDAETMPFQSELVLARSSRQAPFYLNRSTVLNWSCVSVCDSSSMYGEFKAGIGALLPPIPSGFQSCLDPTQISAVNHVLQNRLAIIQGPPGTGKTFLSVKIVELLLSADTRPETPIVIVTYKNQALDQFLEACLHFCAPNMIVRVGGRGNGSALLASCNLQNLLKTGKHNNISSSDWIANCDKLDVLQTELRQALSSLYKCRTFNMEAITTQSSLQGFLQKLLIRKGNMKPESVVMDPESMEITTTDGHVDDKDQQELAQKEYRSLLKKWIPQKAVFNAVQACFSSFMPTSRSDQVSGLLSGKNSAIKTENADPKDLAEEDNQERKEFDEIWQDLKRVNHTGPRDPQDTDWLSNNYLHLADLAVDKEKLFGSTSLADLDLNAYTWLVEADPWELSSEHRCILILLIMQRNIEEHVNAFVKVKQQYDQLCLENAEINKQRRIAILKHAKIIGMTTTGAAINQDILAAISPSIILVEEAAEILEPHLIALLSPSVQHLILVGDHKQLRPSVKCYELETRHNLGISMLERLAEHNKLPFQTLGLQSRMREEFLQMVKPIYPNLKSNISVVNGSRNRPAICMASTMYFWNHSINETAARSPTNKREAFMVVALLKWLLSEGHTHEEISVICAYNGQVSEIRKLLKESASATEKTVDVHTIDRFQGSENRIIIASLVRSNADGRIGHLFAQNRLCVTVSRARSGFYICGNAETLSQKSPHWKTLIDDCFRAQNCLGEHIRLVCPRHPKDAPMPLHSDDAANFSPNICTKTCNAPLECGHCCKQTCHNGDHALCKVKVSHTFAACLHSTMKLCSQPDTNLKCTQKVWIIVEKCGHKKECICWEKMEKISSALECRLPCGKTLPCEHPCTLFCGQKCASKPCKTCTEIERIKAQKEKELLNKQTRERLSHIESQIQKLKSEPGGGPYFQILHPYGDTAAEYHMVKDRTEKFIQPTHHILPVVTKIEKVMHAGLQFRFLQAQQKLKDVLAPSQLLFHGTDDEGVIGITNNGFRLPPPSHDNMFGVGCYFATDSSKSAQKLYTKGSNKLLLCEVLLGRSWSLNSGKQDLDYRSIRAKDYDSVFSIRNSRASGGTQFDEYVVYNPDQAIPRYIIHYKNLDCNAIELQSIFQSEANPAFGRRTLDASSSCFKGVTNDELHFRFAEAQFLRMSHNKANKITSVEFTWNQELHKRYQKRKQLFVAENKPVDEVLVFHGTVRESVDKIIWEGFKVGGEEGVPIRCGAAYGAGVYTAANPEISVPYSQGHGIMLLSLALLGKFGEDYVLGGSKDIYVIKKGDQLLPRYIVHFCSS